MKKLIVYSAKGGTGKSTVSVAIARELRDYGYRVGLLDIDVDCPNIPEFMNIEERELVLTDTGISPKTVDGIEVMSVGLIADTSFAILWDGERRSMAIEQMLNHVDWNIDVLVIDSPPGTSDEIKSMISKFSPDYIIIVTTNHLASLSDTKRGLAMLDILGARKKLLGIIKNMTHIICAECGHQTLLFNGVKDKEIDKLTIAEIPYIENGDSLSPYLEAIMQKIEKVI